MPVFSLVISLVTIGSVVVTVNSKLLGGKVSFFQSLVGLAIGSADFSACWDTPSHRYSWHQ